MLIFFFVSQKNKYKIDKKSMPPIIDERYINLIFFGFEFLGLLFIQAV